MLQVMTSIKATTVPHSTPPAGPAPSRRWLALACISVAQMMVALDATIISIALPSAQRTLQISAPERQWVITAYTLAFGGLLLLGGRLADTLGRRRTFLAGLAGFAAALRLVVPRQASACCSARVPPREPSPPCSLQPRCPC